MKRLFAPLLFSLLTALVATVDTHAGNPEDTLLIVLSGEGRDSGKTRPGYEFDELSQAWLIFKANGINVEIASPQGGAIEADAYNPDEPFNAALLADAEAMQALANTRATRDLRAKDYAAIYIVGGKGAMFDLPKDESLRRLLADAWDGGGIIASICHGPAALVDVRLADGSQLVAGRAMTGFSNDEEAVFGKKWAKEFPWLLETALRERGARWENAGLMMPRLVVDGRLITGQNPSSTPAVAEAIVRAMGREPVAREPWRDERTITLVERLYNGEEEAVRAILTANPTHYHIDLIGVLGYYQSLATQDETILRKALQAMTLSLPHVTHPRLMLGAAEAHLRLGETEQARALAKQALAAKPDMAEATALLQRIE